MEEEEEEEVLGSKGIKIEEEVLKEKGTKSGMCKAIEIVTNKEISES